MNLFYGALVVLGTFNGKIYAIWVCRMAGFVKGLAYKHNPFQRLGRTVKNVIFSLFRMFTSLETNLFSMVGYSHTHKRMFISTMQVGQSRPPRGGCKPGGLGMLALILKYYSLI